MHESTFRVYNSFHKYLLGLPPNTVNIVALGELGRPSFKSRTILKQILYWLKLSTLDSERYQSLCYSEQRKLADRGVLSWGLCVKNIIYEMGFGFIWDGQAEGISSHFYDEFKQRVFDIDRQNWSSEIWSRSSLRCFVQFKTENFVEPYILFNDSFKLKKLVCKLRCACLEIEVNEGRCRNVPYDQRFCQVCNLNQLGDEYHFLLICPFLREIRYKFIPKYFFQPHSKTKCNILLSVNSKYLFYQLSYFILHSMEARRLFLSL